MPRACLSLALCMICMTALPARAQECSDRALTLAAADLLVGDTRAPTTIARARGSTLPVVRGLRTRDGNESRVRSFLDDLGLLAGAPIICGEASSEGRRIVLAGALAAQLFVEDGVARLELAEGWRAPRLYVRDGGGRAHEAPFESGRAELPTDLQPPLRVQVVATGPDGPRPVAERFVGETSEASDSPEATVARSDEPLALRITHLRASTRAAPLRANRLLERVATRHAQEVCRTGRVQHFGQGGDPVERLAREGIRARHVGETAARAADVQAAYAATLRSPSHRAALEDRRMTDVGIGVANGRCLVVLLAAWPRAVPY